MSKHREAYEALKTIANYCNFRDCETECIFYKRKVADGNICCRLVDYKFSPVCFIYDADETIPIKERCEELEVNERIESYKDLEETRNICRKYADEIRGLGET